MSRRGLIHLPLLVKISDGIGFHISVTLEHQNIPFNYFMECSQKTLDTLISIGTNIVRKHSYIYLQ